MDYEKAYKDLKMFVKELYPNLGRSTQDKLACIEPELAKSWEERIRKAIIKGIEYLEHNIGWAYLPDDVDILDAKDWLEKQGEQKPVEWSEKDEKMKQRILTHLYSLIYPNSLYAEDAGECISWLKSLRPQQKQEWSEEDEERIIKLKKFIAQCNGFNKANRQKAFDMIDALHPQPHWKPSEEQTQIADTNNMEHASNLEHWLAFFGMPEENIENCITQIAQGYGAIRYLEGVQHRAEAVNELSQEQPEVDLEKAIDGLCVGWIEGEEYGELQNVNTCNCVTLEEVKEAMRCTFELGLKTRGKDMVVIDSDFNHDVWKDTDSMFIGRCKCQYCGEEFHGRFVEAVHEHIECPNCGRNLSWSER